MDIKQREELKNKLFGLSDEDLDNVAGGMCDAGLIPVHNGCWECDEFGEVFGKNDSIYIKNCT